MSDTPAPGDPFAALVRKLDPGSRLVRAWPLHGGISARVTALEIRRPDGRPQKLVVRQHGEADRRNNPRVAADEFRLLQILDAAGVPVPAPYLHDDSGVIFPTPYIVVEYIKGQPDLAPGVCADQLAQMARHLARIHQIDGTRPDLAFLPQHERTQTAKLRTRPAQLDLSLEEGRIREALEAVRPLPAGNAPVLLHNDFWPGNVLWQDGRLAGIVDWEDAHTGDPLVDLGNSRLEILWALGRDAMQQFTRHYQALARIDDTNLPYWDLCAALRPASRLSEWAGDTATEQAMREDHHWFVAQALAAIDRRKSI